MSARDRAEHTVLFVGGPKHGTMEVIPGYLGWTYRWSDGTPAQEGGRSLHYVKRKAGITINGRYREITCYAINDAPPELLVDAIEKATRKDALDVAQGGQSKLWTPGSD